MAIGSASSWSRSTVMGSPRRTIDHSHVRCAQTPSRAQRHPQRGTVDLEHATRRRTSNNIYRVSVLHVQRGGRRHCELRCGVKRARETGWLNCNHRAASDTVGLQHWHSELWSSQKAQGGRLRRIHSQERTSTSTRRHQCGDELANIADHGIKATACRRRNRRNAVEDASRRNTVVGLRPKHRFIQCERSCLADERATNVFNIRASHHFIRVGGVHDQLVRCECWTSRHALGTHGRRHSFTNPCTSISRVNKPAWNFDAAVSVEINLKATGNQSCCRANGCDCHDAIVNSDRGKTLRPRWISGGCRRARGLEQQRRHLIISTKQILCGALWRNVFTMGTQVRGCCAIKVITWPQGFTAKVTWKGKWA